MMGWNQRGGETGGDGMGWYQRGWEGMRWDGRGLDVMGSDGRDGMGSEGKGIQVHAVLDLGPFDRQLRILVLPRETCDHEALDD